MPRLYLENPSGFEEEYARCRQAGAGFCIKVQGESDFVILKFRKEADGSYFFDPKGTTTDMITDGTGEITIYGLPLGTVWIEDTYRLPSIHPGNCRADH